MDLIDIQVELEKLVDPLANDLANLQQKLGVVEIQKFLDCEPSQRNLIDEICAEFSEQKKWPIGMTPIHRFLIYGRLAQAALFVRFLVNSAGAEAFENPQYDSNHQSKARLYKFLLVDYWDFAGRFRWKG